MKNLSKTVAVFVFLFISPLVIAAGPKDAAQQYIKALQGRDYSKAAMAVDPDALKEYRSQFDFLKDIPGDFKEEFYFFHFGAGETEKSVSEKNDQQFYASLMKATIDAAESAGLQPVDYTKPVYIGAVKEGKLKHVLFRRVNAELGDNSETIEVLSLRKVKKKWMVSINQHMKKVLRNVIAALKPNSQLKR